jgi:hypothetical protein
MMAASTPPIDPPRAVPLFAGLSDEGLHWVADRVGLEVTVDAIRQVRIRVRPRQVPCLGSRGRHARDGGGFYLLAVWMLMAFGWRIYMAWVLIAEVSE